MKKKRKSIRLEETVIDGKKVYGHSRYKELCRECDQEFKNAIAKEYNEPEWNGNITEAIWEKAWEEGCVFGYCEVEICYSELCDLAKEIAENVSKKEI